MTKSGPSIADAVRWLGAQRVTLGTIILLLAVFVFEQFVWTAYGFDVVAYTFAAGRRPSPGWILAPFAHQSLLHLSSSALVVLTYGALVEADIGGLAWFRLYVLAGYVATATQILAYWLGAPGTATLGASGAALGLTAFYAATSVSDRMQTGHWTERYDGIFTVTAVVIVAVLLVNDFSRVSLATGTAPYGHVGGILSGLAVAWWR